MSWYNQKEKGSKFLLKTTLFLVKFTPNFILKFIVLMASFFYYIFSKNERKNIDKFYKNLNSKNRNTFLNFYNFSISIIDKMAVWIGKIQFKDLVLKDKDLILKNLVNAKTGTIILASHYGNIEIARALSRTKHKVKLAILVYNKNMMNFNNLINKISSQKIKIFEVDELDVARMIELRNFLDNGGHLCIMGDRIPLKSNKMINAKFLNQNADFPLGSFYLAYLLKCPINALWCVKNKNKYEIMMDEICDFLDKKSIEKCALKYISLLEDRVRENPTMWFNFFDFWGDDEKSL
ncbi:hypothetical protein F1B92_05985 [Campylobacter sp. FMV-PI01]|uniref:Lipid A biosynthesis acyltransferase n=1 Tax=Campylobacter portucalensis TaxID=2608384 RepID=A0A6L5WLM9_9BACT|nr:hypothetical protein [Campylobacter portucalensis]MSN96713.1 hypothetical protein [Campylobacter portucalensis]